MSAPRPRPDVEVHIGELVLHGFQPGDRRAIGDAVERELARLLAARGLPVPEADASVDRVVDRVAAGPVAPAGGAIAEAVYGAIGGAAAGRGGSR